MSTPVAAQPESRIQTFAEFWPFYLTEHRSKVNRTLHFIGTTGVLALVVTGIALLRPWNFVCAPLCGYGFAWVGHFIIEKTRPGSRAGT